MPSSPLIRVYAARRFTQAVEQAMDARYAVTRNMADTVLDPDALVAAAQGCQYLVVSLTEKVTAQVIARLSPTLKVICTLSVGVDHIDLEAARRAGVKVLYTPDVLSEATAEIAVLLMLGAARRAAEGIRMVRDGAWTGWTPTQLLGRQLTGRRLFAAGLDVYRGEPDMDPRYRTLDNLFAIPHLGSATVETRDAMGFLLLDGLVALEEGRRPANQLV